MNDQMLTLSSNSGKGGCRENVVKYIGTSERHGQSRELHCSDGISSFASSRRA
jgi:hypothetical protein